MTEYFENYKQAKFVLCKLICDFYSYDIEEKEAKRINLNYTNEDIFNSLNKVACIFHRFSLEGRYLWNKVGIESPIITLREMWRITYSVKYEEFNANIDYYRESLEIRMLILDMIKEYYKISISVEDAGLGKIQYEPSIDEIDGMINGYFHKGEETGVEAWNLFSLENKFIAESRITRISEILKDKTIENGMKRERKL